MAQEQIHSLLVPLRTDPMLLPYASVAEIISVGRLQRVPNAPDWLVGRMEWRNRKIPLVRLENFVVLDEPKPITKSQKVIVVKTIGGDPRFQFFAIAIQGLPRVVHVEPQSITESTKTFTPNDAIQCLAVVNGSESMIPNIRGIEKELKKVTH